MNIVLFSGTTEGRRLSLAPMVKSPAAAHRRRFSITAQGVSRSDREMTQKSWPRAALEDAQVLCGYTVYVELIRGLYPDKETYTTPIFQMPALSPAAARVPTVHRTIFSSGQVAL